MQTRGEPAGSASGGKCIYEKTFKQLKVAFNSSAAQVLDRDRVKDSNHPRMLASDDSQEFRTVRLLMLNLSEET